jgi:hypothetical protein
MSHIRGERPTRAGPLPVRKLLTALRRVTGRGARTRVALRGAVTRWSANSELVRFRMVASEIGTPVPLPRIVRERRWLSLPGCRWIGPAGAGRAYRGRQARRQPAMTTRTLTSSAARAAVTGWYKRCEIRLLCGGETGGLSRLFGGLSSSQSRPGPRRVIFGEIACRKLVTVESNRSGRKSWRFVSNALEDVV